MANRNRKEKSFPPHLEYMPQLPEDPSEAFDAMMVRNGAADCGQYHPLSGNKAVVNDEVKLRNERHEAHMEDMRANFEETKNPLFAWDAYLICRRFKRAVPPWVFEYFDEAAFQMMSPYNQKGDLSRILRFPDQKGGATAWIQYLSFYVRRDAAFFVINHLRNQPEATIEHACKAAYEQLQKRWNKKLDLVFKSDDSVGQRVNTINRWYIDYRD